MIAVVAAAAGVRLESLERLFDLVQKQLAKLGCVLLLAVIEANNVDQRRGLEGRAR